MTTLPLEEKYNSNRKKVSKILSITKTEAKMLAQMGLRYHKDIFTGKWKRRHYYLKDDWEGKNIKMLDKLRSNKIK